MAIKVAETACGQQIEVYLGEIAFISDAAIFQVFFLVAIVVVTDELSKSVLFDALFDAADVLIVVGIGICISPGHINGHLVRSDTTTDMIIFIYSSRHNLLMIYGVPHIQYNRRVKIRWFFVPEVMPYDELLTSCYSRLSTTTLAPYPELSRLR